LQRKERTEKEESGGTKRELKRKGRTELPKMEGSFEEQ
jgi:hypothetical protein